MALLRYSADPVNAKIDKRMYVVILVAAIDPDVAILARPALKATFMRSESYRTDFNTSATVLPHVGPSDDRAKAV
jgi:hypothetical protein